MMFKSIVIAVFYIATASASYRENLGNSIEYYEDVSIPHPYPHSQHDNSLQYGQVITAEPFYASHYDRVIVPEPVEKVWGAAVATSEVRHSSSNGMSSASSYHGHQSFSLIKSLGFFIIKKVPALIVGFLTAIGVCMFTPFCSNLPTVHSLNEVPSGLIALATPERLHMASDFVKGAVRMYRSIQNN